MDLIWHLCLGEMDKEAKAKLEIRSQAEARERNRVFTSDPSVTADTARVLSSLLLPHPALLRSSPTLYVYCLWQVCVFPLIYLLHSSISVRSLLPHSVPWSSHLLSSLPHVFDPCWTRLLLVIKLLAWNAGFFFFIALIFFNELLQ